MTEGQYSPVWPSRSVSKRLILFFKSSTSILSSLRSQLLKEMSSIVSNGVKKGALTSSEEQTESEVTVQETMTGHDIEHQDEETLEILQGVNFVMTINN